MMADVLEQERQYLSGLIEAVQRCAYFLVYSQGKVAWPIKGTELAVRKKDAELFETLAAINERFAKLQDTLAAAMRHTALLLGESSDSFLQTLALFEKLEVLPSVECWQQSRMARNIAAHDYATDYDATAEHFNNLSEQTPMLLQTAHRLVARVRQDLDIEPETDSFQKEFKCLLEKVLT